MLYKFLFPRYANTPVASLLILALRLLFGILFMVHGFAKLTNYAVLVDNYPSFMGMGSGFTLVLTMFAELVCAAAFILGFLFRLAVIPMILTMLVAFAWVHHGAIAEGELAFVYGMVFLILALAGPGLYSIDAPLGEYLMYKDDTCASRVGE